MYKKSYLFGIGGLLVFSLLIPKLNIEKTSYQKISQASNNYEIVMPAEGQTNTMGAVVYNQETKQEEIYVWGNIWFFPDLSTTELPGPTHFPLKIDFPILNDYLSEGAIVTEMVVAQYNIDLVLNDTNGYDHVFAWGFNDYSEIGDGTIDDSNVPVEITDNFGTYLTEGGTVNDFDNGEMNQTVYLTDKDGYDHIFSWGKMFYNGAGFSTSLPRDLNFWITDQNGNHLLKEEGSRVIEIESLYGGNTLALEDGDGEYYIFGWGVDAARNLGIPEGMDNTLFFPTPTDFSSTYQNDFDNGYYVKDIDLGEFAGYVLLENDLSEQQVYFFGKNDQGVLGLGEDIKLVENPLNTNYLFEDLFADNYRIKTAEMGGLTTKLVFENNQNGQNKMLITGNDKYGEIGNGIEDNQDAKPIFYQFIDISDQFPELEAGGEIISLESDETTNFAFTKEKDGQTHLYGWGTNAAGEMATDIDEYNDCFFSPYEIIIS